MALNTQAMLANLNISQWTARKHDRKVTDEVEKNHAAKDAGRFNKLLIDKSALEAVQKVASAARDHHYKVTLPWGDNGDRLLPSKLYLAYTQDMRMFRDAFNREVDTFVRDYPQLVQDARKRLGTLYELADYPLVSDIRDRFSFSTAFTPVPDAKDFRVEVAEEDAEKIRHDIEQMVLLRQHEAVKEAYARAKDIVLRVRDRCSAEKPVIRESLMSNVQELIDMLPAFNLTKDPQLDQLARDLKGLVKSPDALRTRADVREDTAKAASDILSKMGWN
jgi:hypothetical protein